MYNPTSQAPKEFEEKVIQVNRVSKKTKGGNRRGFSVIVVIGDKKNRVGVGLGKAPEVQSAVQKAVSYAKKHLLTVNLKGTTIPHEVRLKLGAAQILLKPAPAGTGVIAGGAIRSVVEAAGIKDIVSKVLGTNNKASNVYATMAALKILRPVKNYKSSENEAKKEEVVSAQGAETKEVAKEKIQVAVITSDLKTSGVSPRMKIVPAKGGTPTAVEAKDDRIPRASARGAFIDKTKTKKKTVK